MPKEKPIEREFDLPSVLGGISGVSLSRKAGGLNAVLRFMTGDPTAEFVQAFPKAVRDEILAQHPLLADALDTLPAQGYRKSWFARYRQRVGDHMNLRPLGKAPTP